MTNLICGFIRLITKVSVFLLPDVLFNADILLNFDKHFDYMIDILAQVNFFIPLPDIFAAISVMVTIDIVKFTIFIYNWIVKRIFDIIP